jgi:hypothetical protein
MDLGHWVLAEGLQPNPEAFGFIYEVLNKANGRRYIGKKQRISNLRKPPLKGKKRRRLTQKESDWKTYTSSSNELNEDIKQFGKEQFVFTIIDWGNSKWELGYKEIKKQIEAEVLLKEEFYNGIINVRIGRPPKALLYELSKNLS